MKEILGDEYMDYNLVMASTFGLPLGDGAIHGPLKKSIEDYNLPPVVFHSFRHSNGICNDQTEAMTISFDIDL